MSSGHGQTGFAYSTGSQQQQGASIEITELKGKIQDNSTRVGTNASGVFGQCFLESIHGFLIQSHSISIFVCFCWFCYCWWKLPIFLNQSPFWLVTTPRFFPIFPLASRWWGFPWPAGVDFGLPGASNGRRIFAGLKPGSAATWSDRFLFQKPWMKRGETWRSSWLGWLEKIHLKDLVLASFCHFVWVRYCWKIFGMTIHRWLGRSGLESPWSGERWQLLDLSSLILVTVTTQCDT